MIRNIFLFGLLLFTPVIYGQENIEYSELKLDSIFKGDIGTFVLYDLQKDNYKMYNPDRAKQKFSVHSTSKILWSIIGLEEKLVANGTDIVKWDSIKYARKAFWPSSWAQDQTIVSAQNYSVNWYYFELLKIMTPEMVEKYLNSMDYQKGFKVKKIHYFGLTFLIEKSSIEQIEFLRNLYTNQFSISKSTINTVKRGLVQEKNENYTLYYKTGLGPTKNNSNIGWVIGFIEKGDALYYFAMNVENENMRIAGEKRLEITNKILKHLDLI